VMEADFLRRRGCALDRECSLMEFFE